MLLLIIAIILITIIWIALRYPRYDRKRGMVFATNGTSLGLYDTMSGCQNACTLKNCNHYTWYESGPNKYQCYSDTDTTGATKYDSAGWTGTLVDPMVESFNVRQIIPDNLFDRSNDARASGIKYVNSVRHSIGL